MGAVVRRDVAVATSYPLAVGLSLVRSLFFAISFYFIGEFVGQPEALRDTSAGYFEFALVGVITTGVVGLAIKDFSAALIGEQNAGTLEMVLATPTPIWNLLFGGVVVSGAIAGFEVAMLGLVGYGLLGSGVPLERLIIAAPLLLLTFLAFAAVGIVAAGIIVVVKRGDPLSGPVGQITGLVAGAYYPVEVLPDWLQRVSEVVPATYGLRGMRAVLLEGLGLAAVVDELLVLGGMVGIGIPLSLWFFRRSITSAKRAGTLANY